MSPFDPRAPQPHPPGYFLYVEAARALNFVTHDANLALVILSITASCGAVLLIHRLASEWFGTCIFVLSPGRFHGTVALTYSVEAFFSALLGFLCWRVFYGAEGASIIASLALGVSAGIWPSLCSLSGQQKLLPAHELQMVPVGDKELVFGSTALLPSLPGGLHDAAAGCVSLASLSAAVCKQP